MTDVDSPFLETNSFINGKQAVRSYYQHTMETAFYPSDTYQVTWDVLF